MAEPAADGGYTPTSTDRTIQPRRGLPSGRAVAGALLVTVAAVGAFAAASRAGDGPSHQYLVLTRRVEAGTPIGSADVRLEPMQLPPASAANAAESLAAVAGATATHDLAAGDVLSVHDLVPAPSIDGKPLGAIHELALAVPHERIAARTATGDRVTVLATLTDRDGSVTVVAVEDATVLGWTAAEGLSGDGVLTLALHSADRVGTLAHLALLGDITVVRTTRAIADEYPAYFTGPETAALLDPGNESQAAPQPLPQYPATDSHLIEPSLEASRSVP